MTAPALRHWYPALAAPVGTPANWLFAPIWTLLYVMIGVAAWLVWRRRGPSRPLRMWGWQLAANALWVPAFFGLHSPRLAMGVMVMMLSLTVLTIRAFLPVQRLAGWLMLPYATWCVYAAYLNAGFWLLNNT